MSSMARLGVVMAMVGVASSGGQAHADGLVGARTTAPPPISVQTADASVACSVHVAVDVSRQTPTVPHGWHTPDPRDSGPAREGAAAGVPDPSGTAHNAAGDPDPSGDVDHGEILARFPTDASLGRDPLLKPSMLSAGTVRRPGNDVLLAVGETSDPGADGARRTSVVVEREPSGRSLPAIMTLAVIALGTVGRVRFRASRTGGQVAPSEVGQPTD